MQGDIVIEQEAKEIEDMRSSAQESFENLERIKAKIKEAKDEIETKCCQYDEYVSAQEQGKDANAKKKAIKTKVSELNPDIMRTIDELKEELDEEKEVMTQHAIIAEKKGVQLKLFNEEKEEFYPSLSISFTKKE